MNVLLPIGLFSMVVIASAAAPKKAGKTVAVVGAVQSPGPVTFEEATGILGAVAKAGGFSRRADRKIVKLLPKGRLQDSVRVDLEEVAARRSRAPDIRDGDVVLVLWKE